MDVLHFDGASMTTSAQGELDQAAKELTHLGATPEEIRHRADRYRSGSGPVPEGTRLTVRALLRHWPACGSPAAAANGANLAAPCPPHQEGEPDDDSRGTYCPLCKTWSTERDPENQPEDGVSPPPESERIEEVAP